jgi:DNA gyrase subunit A
MFSPAQGPGLLLKVHEIPQGGRAARASRGAVQSRSGRRAHHRAVPVREFVENKWLMFATRNGTVKKTVLSAYGNVRANGSTRSTSKWATS